jgi:hypothetical protein
LREIEMPDYLEDAVHNILDTFTGADGGVSFMKFRWFVEEMARRQDTDLSAKKILDIVLQFNRLIEIAQKEG